MNEADQTSLFQSKTFLPSKMVRFIEFPDKIIGSITRDIMIFTKGPHKAILPIVFLSVNENMTVALCEIILNIGYSIDIIVRIKPNVFNLNSAHIPFRLADSLCAYSCAAKATTKRMLFISNTKV